MVNSRIMPPLKASSHVLESGTRNVNATRRFTPTPCRFCEGGGASREPPAGPWGDDLRSGPLTACLTAVVSSAKHRRHLCPRRNSKKASDSASRSPAGVWRRPRRCRHGCSYHRSSSLLAARDELVPGGVLQHVVVASRARLTCAAEQADVAQIADCARDRRTAEPEAAPRTRRRSAGPSPLARRAREHERRHSRDAGVDERRREALDEPLHRLPVSFRALGRLDIATLQPSQNSETCVGCES